MTSTQPNHSQPLDPAWQELVEIGRADTLQAVRSAGGSLVALGSLLRQLADQGHYVPAEMPPPDELVLLATVHVANQPEARRNHLAPGPLVELRLVKHQRALSRDLDNATCADLWATPSGQNIETNAVEQALLWLPLPAHWHPVDYVGMGAGTRWWSAADTTSPLNHLALSVTPDTATKEQIDPDVVLRFAEDWQTTASHEGGEHE